MEKERWSRGIAAALLCLAFTYMIVNIAGGTGTAWGFRWQRGLLRSTERMYLPGAVYAAEENAKPASQWLLEQAFGWIPLVEYLDTKMQYRTAMEDEETIAKILENQANDGHFVDQNGNPIGGTEVVEDVVPAQGQPVLDMSIEKLRDFDYLLSNFYTVDSSTMIGPEQLNADNLLARSMKIDTSTQGPKVLVFHTHSQEEFADSTPGNPAESILGIGEYLVQLLNAKGINTIHDTGVYDIINGELDRSNAYENAEASIRPVLEANPTIEVVIDLHRDGVAEGTHLVTEVDGKPTAKIMYFNGLSRTRTNGDIEYLYNPYIQDNLAFSLQMQLASESMYPGFARHIYLRGYRYNLHLMPKSLLIEAGAQTNTVEEMRNAMEVLAETLHQVLL